MSLNGAQYTEYSCPFVGGGYALNTRLSFSHLFNFMSRLMKQKKYPSAELISDEEDRTAIRFYFNKRCYLICKTYDEYESVDSCTLIDETDPDKPTNVDYAKCHKIYRSIYEKY